MSTRFRSLRVVLALAASGAPALHAQVTPAPIEDASTDVVPVRAVEGMSRDREQAAVDEQVARDSADGLRAEVSRAKARIDIHKSELETVRKRLELAKKEKRESDRLDLEAVRKAGEADLRLLERLRELQDSRLSLMSARGDAARAWKRAVEAEQALAARRAAAARPEMAVSPAPIPDPEARRAARRVLELQRDAAIQRRDVADREREVAQRQLDVLDAQTAIFEPRR